MGILTNILNNILYPPKTVSFNEYKNVSELYISSEMYDKISSLIDDLDSKPQYSQGLVTVKKDDGRIGRRPKYNTINIIPFRDTYDHLFSNDDLKQVIGDLKRHKGSKVGFIYHIIENQHEDFDSQFSDLKNQTIDLVNSEKENPKTDDLIHYNPILNSAWDCGHVWIEKKDEDYDYDLEHLSFHVWLPTYTPLKNENLIEGIIDVRKIDGFFNI